MNTSAHQPDDIILIRAALLGDKASFSELVDRYKGMVFNLLYRLTGNLAEAEDLTQESFMRAYKNLSQFNLAQDFRNWIYTIAVNTCRSSFRKKRPFFFSLDGQTEEEATPQLGDHKDDPEQQSLSRESEERVQKIINSLPFKYRTVFVLRYVEEKSYQEIAAITSMPLGTIKTYLFRGQKMLVSKITAQEK
jgi:RNA polymerase sigma-70 factor (ECF subfamily)